MSDGSCITDVQTISAGILHGRYLEHFCRVLADIRTASHWFTLMFRPSLQAGCFLRDLVTIGQPEPDLKLTNPPAEESKCSRYWMCFVSRVN